MESVGGAPAWEDRLPGAFLDPRSDHFEGRLQGSADGANSHSVESPCRRGPDRRSGSLPTLSSLYGEERALRDPRHPTDVEVVSGFSCKAGRAGSSVDAAC